MLVSKIKRKYVVLMFVIRVHWLFLQEKKVKISPKEKKDTENLQKRQYSQLAGEKGGHCACQVENWV